MKTIRQFLLRPYLYLVILIIGTVLKFYQLDNRLFWFDEVCTIQHTSGIPLYKYSEFIPINEISNISVYNDLLHLNRQNYKIDTQITGLFSDTHLTPLHYSFLIFWHRIVGDDFMDYRLFSVFIFIITLPFLFLLTKTIYRSDLSGWIAISLYAVSPIFHNYSQEARYLILWAFFLIVSHYLFLQAIRYNKLKWWIGYFIIGILALYTSVMSGLIIFGHLIYIWFLKKELRYTFAINLFIILLFYSPWIYSMIIHRNEIYTSLSWHTIFKDQQYPWEPLIWQFLGFERTFIFLIDYWSYLDILRGNELQRIYIILLLDTLILSIIIFSIIYFLRKSAKEVSYFLMLIVIPQFLFFYISDLVRSAWSSFIWRYHVINFIGILLIVVYLLNDKIARGKLFYSSIYLGLVIIGIASILKISNNRCFYIPQCQSNIKAAQLFSNASKPLIITDFSSRLGLGEFLVVLTECTSENIDILRVSPEIKNVKEKLFEKDYSAIYVFHASDQLIHNFKSQFGVKMDSLEYEDISPIWQIEY